MAVGDEAPGWDGITAAFAAVYPGVEPVHKAPVPGLAFGGGVDGISAYRGSRGWHLVTYGLTELYRKESEDAGRSGWGYELTLLLPDAEAPPLWAFDLLHGLARTTYDSARPHEIGHRIDLLESIDGESSAIEALAVATDPLVAPGEFPFGRYAFHRLVGITRPELEEMKATSTAEVLERFEPALLTDPLRMPASR